MISARQCDHNRKGCLSCRGCAGLIDVREIDARQLSSLVCSGVARIGGQKGA